MLGLKVVRGQHHQRGARGSAQVAKHGGGMFEAERSRERVAHA
jgi:hypothetical protein